ncbi:MAG: hypothetical protein WA814_03160 [Candidatus Baltobacteraceae bacterium]
MSPLDRRGRWIAAAILILLALGSLRDLARLGDALPWRTMDDFPDFYCAGAALNEGRSPYTYEPLHGCEHRVNVGAGFRAALFAANPAVAVPAPQPPYDFPPFMALAHLPIGDARAIDAIAIVLSVALCALALAGMGVPFDLALASLALSAGYAELNTGQIVPFALLALVLCGFALERGRERLAGVAAALVAIEPTVGVPVVLATLLFVPRARWPLLATVAILALTALALVGPAGLLAYFALVLPAHALSELHFPFQYGSTYLLTYLGVPAAAVRPVGAFVYVAGLAAGLWLAPRAARALRVPAMLAFLPAMVAVAAAPFLHQEELALAIPAALLLATRSAGARRTLATIALCVLSIPWIAVWGIKRLFLASLFVCAVILLRLRIEIRAAILILCALAAGIYAFEIHSPQLPTPAPSALRSYAPNELVQAAWRDYTQARATPDVLWLIVKIPSWAALLALLGIAVAVVRDQTETTADPFEPSISRRI